MSDPIVRYHHHHISVLLLGAFLAIEAVIGLLLYFSPHSAILWCSAILLIVFILNFYSLSVVIDDQWVGIKYGLGFIVRTIELASVRNATLVPNRHLRTWCYNSRDKEVIELQLKDGGAEVFETEQPDKTVAIIRARVEAY